MARNNVLAVALVISTLFHLSMVSVFSIVIRFPTHGIHYFPLEIAAPDVARHTRVAPRDLLRTSSPDALIDEPQAMPLDTEPGQEALAELPPVELPRLQLAEADSLRTPEQSLKIRSQFTGLFEPRQPEMPDSWALFTHQLRQIGPTLSRWTLAEEPKPEDTAQKVATSVPGIGISIEWVSNPKQRKVLLAPPMLALLNIEPGSLTEPIAFVFTVNPQGKVTEVHSPAVGDTVAIDEIRGVLLRYVFEPLEAESAQNQTGTLLIKAEVSEP